MKRERIIRLPFMEPVCLFGVQIISQVINLQRLRAGFVILSVFLANRSHKKLVPTDSNSLLSWRPEIIRAKSWKKSISKEEKK